MTRRWILLVVALLAGAAALGLLWRQRATPPVSREPQRSSTAAGGTAAQGQPSPPAPPAASRLELGAEVHGAGADDDIVVVVRLFDAEARQAEAIRVATGGQWKGRRAGASTTAVALPDGWRERVQLAPVGGGTALAVRDRVGGPGDAVRLVAARPPAGTVFAATLDVDGVTVRSDGLPLEAPSTDAFQTVVERARVAELLERWDALSALADNLVRRNDRSAWGHYFQGLVARSRGDAAAEAAAFQRALNRVEPGEEMPIGLLRR